MGLGGRSFCRIGLWRFPVRLFHGSPCVLEVGLFVGSNHVGFLSDCFVDCILSFGLVRSLIFFCYVASIYPFVFGGGAFCQGVEGFSAETY